MSVTTYMPLSGPGKELDPAWTDSKLMYRIELAISKDEYGVFSAVAANLPGAGSSGSTEEEAIERAKESIEGILESYTSKGKPIPWRNASEYNAPKDATRRLILVNG